MADANVGLRQCSRRSPVGLALLLAVVPLVVGRCVWPVTAPQTSGFGVRTHPLTDSRR